MSEALVLRLLVVVVLTGGLVAARLAWESRRRRIATQVVDHPELPTDLRGTGTTWVVFTTPYCATCGPTAELLRRSEPQASVVMVDVTERPDLADGFSVRAAPTVVRADEHGRVDLRLVGATAVRDFTLANA